MGFVHCIDWSDWTVLRRAVCLGYSYVLDSHYCTLVPNWFHHRAWSISNCAVTHTSLCARARVKLFLSIPRGIELDIFYTWRSLTVTLQVVNPFHSNLRNRLSQDKPRIGTYVWSTNRINLMMGEIRDK